MQWLHSLGVPFQMLQVLGRWASLTIMKYLQSAPLAAVPEVAAAGLAQGRAALRQVDGWDFAQPSAAALEVWQLVVELTDSDVDREPRQPRVWKRRTTKEPRTSAAEEDSAGIGHVEVHGGSDSQGHDFASRANVVDLQREMVLIQEALSKFQCETTYIVQGRTRRHHLSGTPERANHPSAWATACGWRYGLSKFNGFRVCAVADVFSWRRRAR